MASSSNLNMFKILLVMVVVPMMISSCVVYPKVNPGQSSKCILVTKELTIDIAKVEKLAFSSGGGKGELGAMVLILAGSAVAASTSLIVSGSIMVTGNTLHWLEEEGTCKKGIIREAVVDLSDSLVSAGGWVVNSTEELLNWVSQKEETLNENK